MKIYSDSFKKWSRVLEAYQEKGSPVGECLYFNFKDSSIYFGNKEGIGKMQFNFEKELNEETITNFFISTSKFLGVITQYDFMNLNEKLVFTNGKDKFKISTIIDDDKIDCTTFKTLYPNELVFDKDHLDKISKSLIFTSKDEGNTNYRNIFIQDGTICSLTTRTPMYEAPIDIKDKLCISLNVAKTIGQVGFVTDGCSLMTNTGVNKKIVSRDGEMELIVPGNSNVEFPTNTNPDFIKSYAYETKIKLATDEFSKVLSLLRPYFSDVLNGKLTLTIDDDLSVKVEDTANAVERHIPYIETSDELKGLTFSISGPKIEQALSVLKGKEVFISLPTLESSPIVNFWNDESQHVLIARFKNE